MHIKHIDSNYCIWFCKNWCYVYNFNDPDVPTAVSLDPGKGLQFRKDMERLIKSLQAEIPKEFESKEYEKERGKILEEFQSKQKDLFTAIEEEAASKGFEIKKTAVVESMGD